MSEHVKKIYKEMEEAMPVVQKTMPNAVNGFMNLFQKTMGQGTLTVLEKELIALGIGLAVRCEPCIFMHIQKAVAAGAMREQIIEAAEVAVMMQGGPGFAHLPIVLEALEANGK